MKKGFVFSVSLILLLTIILTGIYNYSDFRNKDDLIMLDDFAANKLSYVLDDLATDVLTVLNQMISINRDENYTTIIISDKMNSDQNRSMLSSLKTFYDATYSQKTNVKFDLNFANLLDGKTELLFSNNFEYDFDYSNANVKFFKTDANVSYYKIDVYVNATSTSRNTLSSSLSGVYLIVNFHDLNASNNYTYSGYVDGTSACGTNWLQINYGSEYFRLELCNDGTRNNTLQMSETLSNTSQYIDYNGEARMPYSATIVSAGYNAISNISQNNVSYTGNLLLAQG